MNSKTNVSSKLKLMCLKHNQSPQELKEKMRKNYKDKVKSCRNTLLDKFRDPENEIENKLSTTLTEIYKTLYSSEDVYDDEMVIFEEFKNELIQEELEWWKTEYDRCQLGNYDWSTLEDDDSVICPVCKKFNLHKEHNHVSCPKCQFIIESPCSLTYIKRAINSSVEMFSHSRYFKCPEEMEEMYFNVMNFGDGLHMYYSCAICSEVTEVF